MEVLLEQRGLWVLQEAQGPPGLLANRDQWDQQDLLDQLVIRASRVPQDHKDQQVKLVTWVSRDQLDPLEHQVLQVNQDRKDPQVHKEMPGREDPLGI